MAQLADILVCLGLKDPENTTLRRTAGSENVSSKIQEWGTVKCVDIGKRSPLAGHGEFGYS